MVNHLIIHIQKKNQFWCVMKMLNMYHTWCLFMGAKICVLHLPNWTLYIYMHACENKVNCSIDFWRKNLRDEMRRRPQQGQVIKADLPRSHTVQTRRLTRVRVHPMHCYIIEAKLCCFSCAVGTNPSCFTTFIHQLLQSQGE